MKINITNNIINYFFYSNIIITLYSTKINIMKNEDKPINPIVNQHGSPVEGFQQKACSGLTKLEYFSGLAMQSILSNNDLLSMYPDSKEMCNLSIDIAQELLTQLENNKL